MNRLVYLFEPVLVTNVFEHWFVGVTSFNIDFAAKKVTVTGDITPLGILDSISKVKNAQFWTAPTLPTPNLPMPNLETPNH